MVPFYLYPKIGMGIPKTGIILIPVDQEIFEDLKLTCY